MKRILPSLRQKKRYLVFEIVADSKISDFEPVSKAIWAKALALLGELGTSKAGILILPEKFDATLQRGIIKVGHKHVDHMKTVLTMVESINNQKVILRCVGVSGILKKDTQKYMIRK